MAGAGWGVGALEGLGEGERGRAARAGCGGGGARGWSAGGVRGG